MASGIEWALRALAVAAGDGRRSIRGAPLQDEFGFAAIALLEVSGALAFARRNG